MESHPYTKTRGVGPVTTQLTPGAEPASCPLPRNPQAHPAHGPVHQHAERGANPLCHLLQIQSARVRAVLAARAIRVRALLGARAIRVRALLGARAIIVGPHPPPFYTSSLTSPSFANPCVSIRLQMPRGPGGIGKSTATCGLQNASSGRPTS